MKKYKIALMALALFITVAACVYPVSADILSDYRTLDIDPDTRKVHVVVTLTGGEEGARASEYPRDFVILMDVSFSMRAVYKDKARLEWAKNATVDFLESLYAYKSRVGIVAFSDDAVEVCPLTFNFAEVKEGIENVSCYGFSTNYGEGIQKATLLLKGREKEALPIIIILTDGGEDNGAISVEDAVDFAMKEGIVIYVVCFGQKENIDEVMLREKIAKPTGGEYRYTNFEELGDALIGMQELEEFLSAVNLHIVVSQTEDAVLDYLSIEEMIKPGLTLTKKGYFEFVSPKLTPKKKIELEFDSFTAKEGNITAGIVDTYYIDKEGVRKSIHVPIITSVIVQKPIWETHGLIFFILMFIFISSTVISYMMYDSLKKKKGEEIRSLEHYLNTIKGKKLDDPIVEEIKRRVK